MTNDYSVGLFNDNVDDIYHSAFGALTESYEKFIIPTFFNINNTNRVLDICYGIGYNTKSFLNELLNNYIKKDIIIDCVDNDLNLIKLSPFIKKNISPLEKFFNRKILYKNILSYKKCEKIIQKNKILDKNKKLRDEVNLILLKNIINNLGYNFLSNEQTELINKNENHVFFDKNMLNFYYYLSKLDIHYYKKENLSTFVHNIYYKYVSKRYSIDNFISLNNQYKVNFYSNDIRTFLVNSSNVYDLIFLDGFTPSKCPCIWSVDLLGLMYEHLSNNGLLVTYNTSAPVRNALKLSGFFIGNTINEKNKIVGTIASKNSNLIKNSLSDDQTGLLNTKAGIPYRDYNLKLDNDTILLNRENEVLNSDLISSSKYLKGIKNEI